MKHLYFTFIAICFLYRCFYVSVIPFSQWDSLRFCQFIGAPTLSIPYTKYNVQIIKGIHDRFHGILGVVMVSGGERGPYSALPSHLLNPFLFWFIISPWVIHILSQITSVPFQQQQIFNKHLLCARLRA